MNMNLIQNDGHNRQERHQTKDRLTQQLPHDYSLENIFFHSFVCFYQDGIIVISFYAFVRVGNGRDFIGSTEWNRVAQINAKNRQRLCRSGDFREWSKFSDRRTFIVKQQP